MLKIKKGDQAAYNAKMRRNRIKGNRSKVMDTVQSYQIGHGLKADHETRAAETRRNLEMAYQGKFKPDAALKKSIWDDYDVDVMCIKNNPNFILLHTDPNHPMRNELLDVIAEEEEVPRAMVVDVLDMCLGNILVPHDMTVEDVLPLAEEMKTTLNAIDEAVAQIPDEEVEAALDKMAAETLVPGWDKIEAGKELPGMWEQADFVGGSEESAA